MAFLEISRGRLWERSERIFTESSQRSATSCSCRKLIQMTVISYSAGAAPAVIAEEEDEEEGRGERGVTEKESGEGRVKVKY
jgi:hypothetical protein